MTKNRDHERTAAGMAPSIAAAVAVLLAGVVACSGSSEPVAGLPPGLNAIVVDGVGLDRPESLLHDAVDDVYLVGNTGPDATGFIARLSARGVVQHLRWIDGADAGVQLRSPGGMAIRGDSLYVADGECVRLFQRSTGATAGSVCPPGATSLNDVTVDARGIVYVSDRGSGAVYVVDASDGITEMTRHPALEQSGGISAGGRGVFVAGAGLYQLAVDGPRAVLRDQGKRLGGIVFTSDGSFAFSNRSDSTVLFVEIVDDGSHGRLWTLAREIPSPGDLGYDSRRERILIPQPEQNRLVFVSLKP